MSQKKVILVRMHLNHYNSSNCYQLQLGQQIQHSSVYASYFIVFSVSGPIVWNALPDYLRNPTLPIDVFTSYLKTFLFAHY